LRVGRRAGGRRQRYRCFPPDSGKRDFIEPITLDLVGLLRRPPAHELMTPPPHERARITPRSSAGVQPCACRAGGPATLHARRERRLLEIASRGADRLCLDPRAIALRERIRAATMVGSTAVLLQRASCADPAVRSVWIRGSAP